MEKTVMQDPSKRADLLLKIDGPDAATNRPVQFIRVKKGADGKLQHESAEDSSAMPEMMDRIAAMREGKLALTKAEFEEFQSMSAPAQAAFSVKRLREQARILKRYDAAKSKKFRSTSKAERRARRGKQ